MVSGSKVKKLRLGGGWASNGDRFVLQIDKYCRKQPKNGKSIINQKLIIRISNNLIMRQLQIKLLTFVNLSLFFLRGDIL